MAALSGVTKRTIDYYTQLGLLQAERSASNYRYYDRSALDTIHFIEHAKNEGKTLDEIKKMVFGKRSEEIDVLELRLKIRHLEEDVEKVLAQLKETDPDKYQDVKKKLSPESLSLIQSLLLLLN